MNRLNRAGYWAKIKTCVNNPLTESRLFNGGNPMTSSICKRLLFAACAMTALAAQPATAQQIVGAASATINSGGPGDGLITQTLDQSGLYIPYVAGVTNFDSYIATNPQHSLVFSGNEWFANAGSTSASVTYDLGAILGIDAVALWNEDFSGIGTLNLFSSTDGILFAALLGVNPADTLNNADYGPQVFNFGALNTRFVRFDMSNCPQQPSGYESCAIGEVAFRTAATGAVPEPATWAMMLLGFGGIGFSIRRRRKAGAMAQFA